MIARLRAYPKGLQALQEAQGEGSSLGGVRHPQTPPCLELQGQPSGSLTPRGVLTQGSSPASAPHTLRPTARTPAHPSPACPLPPYSRRLHFPTTLLHPPHGLRPPCGPSWLGERHPLPRPHERRGASFSGPEPTVDPSTWFPKTPRPLEPARPPAQGWATLPVAQVRVREPCDCGNTSPPEHGRGTAPGRGRGRAQPNMQRRAGAQHHAARDCTS